MGSRARFLYNRVNTDQTQTRHLMISAQKALERLRAGNRDFVAGTEVHDREPQHARVAALATQQQPFAVILGCSDSRVSAEIVFNQGLGDLFVIRVIGNIVTPSQVGSIEFGAAALGARLVVVLGHSCCGAVLATVDALEGRGESDSPGVRSVVARIRPSVEPLFRDGSQADRDARIAQAVRANVAASVDFLRRESAILAELSRSDGLRIVGAEYSLRSGTVDFFDQADLD